MAYQIDDLRNKIIGIPFVPFGRDFTGWDCWGVVYCIYNHMKDIELPSYLENYTAVEAKREIGTLITKELHSWVKVDKEEQKPLDVVLIRIGGVFCHVGLSLSSNEMIHVAKGIDTCIEDYTGIRWVNRIEGIYRYVG